MLRWKPLALLVLASLGAMYPVKTNAQGDGVFAAELVVRGRAAWSDVQAASLEAGAEVSATLRDDAGQPLAGVPVGVKLLTTREPDGAGTQVSAVSESDGRVTARLESDAAGDARVVLEYSGSALVEGARAEARVRLGQVEASLSLEVPPQLNADAPPPFVVRLQDARGAPIAGAEVALSLDDAPPTVERTRDDGVAGFSVARVAPGRHTLTARVAGDARRTEAVERRIFEAVRVPDVQARVAKTPSQDDPMSAPLVIEAEVTGPPSDALDLRLLVDGKAVSLARPDAGGRATIEVPRRRIAAGTRTLEVEVAAREDDWAVVRSAPMQVTLPPHDATVDGLVGWVASGLALSSLGALLFTALAKRRGDSTTAAPPASARLPPRPDFEVMSARSTNAGGAPATLVITALDAVSGAPVRAAVRWLEPGGEVTWTREDGTAILRGPGHVLEVSARGFVTARPHCRVERATEATVRLMPLRAAIQRALESWLARCPDPQPLLGRETLVEIEQRMRLAGHAEATVTPLMRAVEAALFADATPDEATLSAVEAKLSALEPWPT